MYSSFFFSQHRVYSELITPSHWCIQAWIEQRRKRSVDHDDPRPWIKIVTTLVRRDILRINHFRLCSHLLILFNIRSFTEYIVKTNKIEKQKKKIKKIQHQ